ncbi:MAG: NAD(P)/FAD-dependent oxidoreductase [Bacteroidia bacterium]
MKDVIIIGGGLAGLTSAILLGRAGFDVLVIEKNQYPYHKVCGEYIANEVLPFLKSLGVEPERLNATKIKHLQISAPSGRLLEMPLDLGGFGISRQSFDHHLYEKAISAGTEFLLNTKVYDVKFTNDVFEVEIPGRAPLNAKVVIGTFGKRSNIDRQLSRKFMQQRSPWMGVKYHVRLDYPDDLIALHNFHEGYCGIAPIEFSKVNICYLTSRDNLKKHGSILEMEKQVLYKNPYLQAIFSKAHYLFMKPEVINEISFGKKEPVWNHILMAGDAAGMIAPLCGNGMAMAIHAGKIAAEECHRFLKSETSRSQMEQAYSHRWDKLFAQRLWAGRQIQRLFGEKLLTEAAISIAKNIPPLARFLVKKTHGETF